MREIELTQGKVALIDDEDFDRVSKYKWCFHHHGYAVARFGKRMCFMHRFIMNTPQGLFTDHKDHNRLNNQKSNLRICTHQGNNRNKLKESGKLSIYKGVSIQRFPSGSFKYVGCFTINYQSKRKYFPNTPQGEIDAARWYNEMALKHFGEFAVLNKLQENIKGVING
jgi:hypothetical protein